MGVVSFSILSGGPTYIRSDVTKNVSKITMFDQETLSCICSSSGPQHEGNNQNIHVQCNNVEKTCTTDLSSNDNQLSG